MLAKYLNEYREKLISQVASEIVDGNNYLEIRDKQVTIKNLEYFINKPQELIRKTRKRTKQQKDQTQQG